MGGLRKDLWEIFLLFVDDLSYRFSLLNLGFLYRFFFLNLVASKDTTFFDGTLGLLFVSKLFLKVLVSLNNVNDLIKGWSLCLAEL